MKTLTKLALAALILTTALAGQAESVRGYFRSNGTYVAPYYRTPANGTPYDNLSYSGHSSSSRDYIYRNPYAAYPSVSVRGYYRSSGTYVAPHVRTAPNDTVTDNLSYRGFGTIRVPKSSLGGDFSLPTSGFSAPRTLPALKNDFSLRLLGEWDLGF